MRKNLALEALLATELGEFSPTLVASEAVYELVASQGAKRVVLVWPLTAQERFFDFYEGATRLFSESVEYYENETLAVQVQEAARVVRNFLGHESRIVEVGGAFKHAELQCRREAEWISVFS